MKKTDDSKQQSPTELEAALEKIIELEEQLAACKDKEQRALADYQNLVRRGKEERERLIRFAATNFVENLLQPLEHLSMAAEQVNDSGMNMVVEQLWQALEDNGLKEVPALGKEFDVSCMEAVDREGDGDTVVKVVKRGYTLNGEVIQHAKVVVGS